MQVNRYLEDKAMDHIDHALGRPVDPLGETYRNYFYVVGDTELRRQMASSPNWVPTSDGDDDRGQYFAVSDEGRRALAAHLKAIGDKNRLWIVSWGEYEMPTVATTRAQARYRKWLDVSDTNDNLTFTLFQRESTVRLA